MSETFLEITGGEIARVRIYAYPEGGIDDFYALDEDVPTPKELDKHRPQVVARAKHACVVWRRVIAGLA